jgi:hypothetical protein
MEPSDHRSSRALVGHSITTGVRARFDETLEASNSSRSYLVGEGMGCFAIENGRSLIGVEGARGRITL